ncbi:MAG: FmdB family zinc ribbon protein [Candidatus Sulfomarinibacteraceae bacterium]
MPLYEYQCEECEHRYERIERASSPHNGTCPSCGGEARRLLGAPALKFKGSGWYVTDYGKGNRSHPAPTETTSEAAEKPAAATSEKSSPSTSTPAKDSKVA